MWGCTTNKLEDVPNEQIIAWYTVDLLTMQEIADRTGVTRQSVCARVRRMGALVAYRGGPVWRKCDNCGELYLARRKALRSGRARHCSMRCYHEHRSVFGKYSKKGQQMAREVCSARSGEVIHHINGNNYDNRPGNLIVFRSHAQHAGFHKSGAARWLLDQVEKKEIVLTTITVWPKGKDFTPNAVTAKRFESVPGVDE